MVVPIWWQFIAYLAYKAESTGRRLIAVNPAYTSQDCSRCGHRQRKELSERAHRYLPIAGYRSNVL
ncbi:MAG TPA: zinc ribbon domain-containing protein [Chloroflexota bacterium]|nr:zinc ribbon domain-containing protein [Chloroflexota bacterium]